MVPSTTGRCGPKGGPIGPFTGGSNGSIRAHISSVNTAVRDMHPRSRPQHVQLVRHALAERVLDLPTWLALLLVFALPALEASASVGFVVPGEIGVRLGGVLSNQHRV